jgi:hypothetical protein
MTIGGVGHRKPLTGTSWLCLIPLCCLSGRCIGQTYNGFTYSIRGTNITITGYTGPAGAVSIPSSIPGVDGAVTAIGGQAFYGCSGLTSVTIPNSVTYIGEYAFNQCSGLTAFMVDPQNTSYSSLGGVLFDKGRTTLIQCPSGITGAYSIPSGIAEIGYDAFGGCSGLTGITIPTSVTAIGDWAFYECSGLTSVTIPGSVTSIGNYGFWWCGGLTNVTIASGVTTIGVVAFSDCRALTSVTIPNSVTNIGGEAPFFGCSSLTAIAVDMQNPSYSSLGGVLFDKGQTTLLQYPLGRAGGYTVPSTVTSIGGEAFAQANNLTRVTIPSSVTSIASGAFELCSGLTSVTIPNSMTSIGGWAFYGCSGLTSVTIASGVTTIGDQAFADCSGLASVYFQGDAPSDIGVQVFENTAPGFSIYYPSTASGWSTPTWQGYPAQPYDYTPIPPQPLLTLTFGSGAVMPSFNHLQPGRSYQLQVSSDLKAWNNTGVAFTATSTSQVYAQPFNVADSNWLFFRLRLAP